MSKPAVPVIQVEGLGKRYRIGEGGSSYRTLRDALVQLARAPQRRGSGRNAPGGDDTIWALRDVSFQVSRGDVLGVIGRNGAGKTTLLRVLSHITEPTEGRAVLQGRVGSLLEVGTGFHPELTGRENIFLNGAILGMKRKEIELRFDEIVEFAEVEQFIDTPVKRYSSGMYLRLAFAVAAHLDPEILLVDEVLAVGDAEFQRKCLGKMSEVSEEGRTVLFVSHNMSAILNLTREAILLERGRLVEHGPTEQVVDRYLASGFSQTGERIWSAAEVPPSATPFRPSALRALTAGGEVADTLRSVEPITLELEYQLADDIQGLRIGLVITTTRGEVLLTTFDTDTVDHFERYAVRPAGRYRNKCILPADFLNAGQYAVTVIASAFKIKRYFREDAALTFTVDPTGAPGAHWPEARPGPARPRLEWAIERRDPGERRD